MTDIVEQFYRQYLIQITKVVKREASSPTHKNFFIRIYKIDNWKNDITEHQWLENYIKVNRVSLNRSLGQIGITHNRSQTTSQTTSEVSEESTESTLRRTKNFFELNENITEDSEIVDAVEEGIVTPTVATPTTFKRPEPNIHPKTSRGRDDLITKDKIIYVEGDDSFKRRLEELPSSARNSRRFIDLSLYDNYDYTSYFKPHTTKSTLYKKEQAKKFYGPRGTWMFDLMYFKDYNNKTYRKTASYLIGININTRYAVCQRVRGKAVKDLIPAFTVILRKVKDIKYLIFDGEKGIVSKQFEDFCKTKNINVRITYPGIHTQTAPIDRLCRTVRDDFMKYFLAQQKNIVEITQKRNPWLQSKERKYDILTQLIHTRKMFNGEDRYKLAPIPSLYATYHDNFNAELKSYLLTDEEADQPLKPIPYNIAIELSDIEPIRIVAIERAGRKEDLYEDLKAQFSFWGVHDELEDVIEVYNKRPHHGLIKLLKYAQAAFGQPLPLDIDISKVSPEYVHSHPHLEHIIIEYCKYYNSNIAQPSYEYKIGEKVKVYDCFNSNRGSLMNRNEYLIGDWEIYSKDNEIYGVVDNNNERLIHVSKYMLEKK